MRRVLSLPFLFVLTPFPITAGAFSESDFVGIACSSRDNGETCYGYSETYDDGTSDSCGRMPDGGPEFALRLTYEVSGNTKCETVVKSSHPEIMPVGEKFCAVYLSREQGSYTYRFTDDDPGRVRRSFAAVRSDKWCQHLIDAL